MKIVCDSCGAKYSIADEKVHGKVFKIRCKKCSNVIVVKGTAEAEGAGGEDLGGGAGAAEWYVVIEGEQVGPVTSVEIDSYFTSGQISAETYAWKDGMGDWMHVVDIPEFRHLAQEVAGPNEATTIADSGQRYDQGEVDATNVVHSPLAMGAEPSEPTMHDTPSSRDYADPYASEPGYGDDEYGYAASGDDGGYSGFASSYDSSGSGMGGELAAAGGDDDGGGMFAAFDTGSDSDFMNFGDSAPASTNGSNGSNGAHAAAALADGMVGQRNENSVLFSLSSLDGVPAVGGGGGGGADVPVTEGSGLIDIQALATAHKSMSSGGDLDGGGMDPFAQGSMAMPALMPMGSHRSNNTLYIALAAGAVVLFVVLGLGMYLVLKDDPKPVEPTVKVVERYIERPQDSDAEKAKAALEADEAAKAAAAAEAAVPKKVEAEDEGSDKKEVASASRKTTSKSSRKSTSSKKDDDEDEKEAPAPKPKSKKDGIDSILDKIDEKADEKESASSSSNSLPKALDRTDVKKTINRYNSRISTCAKSQNKAGSKGTIKVKFYIQPNGRVRGETVVSSGFKGTDVGTCVQKVVGSMTFPKTSASKDVPVTYPFIL